MVMMMMMRERECVCVCVCVCVFGVMPMWVHVLRCKYQLSACVQGKKKESEKSDKI